MKLELTNFRCYENKKFEFPESGLVLISGDSGSGKSTIINAIYYALYGKLKKPCSFNTTSCKVKLEIKVNNETLIITRTNKPNHLKLVYQQKEKENDEAQQKIDELFMSHDEYLISCYIQQKSSNCLLGMTPAVQLSILQSLTVNDLNLKEKIKNQLKVDSDQLKSIKDKLTAIKVFEKVKPEKVKKPKKEKIDLNRLKELYTLQNEFIQNSKLLEEKEELIVEQKKLKKRRKSLESQILDLDSDELSVLKNKLTDLKFDELLKKTQVKNEKRMKEIKIEPLKDIQKLESDHKNYELFLKISNTLGNHELLLPSIKKVIKEMITDADKQLLECPNCNVKLLYSDKKLIKTKKTSLTKFILDLETLQEWDLKLKDTNEIFEITDEDIKLAKKHNKLQNELQAELKMLKEYKYEYRIDEVDEVDEIDEIDEVEEKIKELESQIQENNKIKLELKGIDPELMKISNKLDRLSKIPTDSPNYEKEIKELENNCNSDWDEYSEYLKAQREWEEYNSEFERLSEELQITEKKYRGTLILKEKYQEAEIYALESTLNSINERMGEYLQEFFEDDLQISLEIIDPTNQDKLPNHKSSKLEIKTVLGYQGNIYDNINQLSGGEYDRCNLASVCSLNDQLNSSLLILDESLSSLDSNKNTEILNFLKKISENKLILVCSHEAVKGIFTDIIEI